MKKRVSGKGKFTERVDFVPLAQYGNTNDITISVEEYTRLKDIETRFAILKEQMLQMEYFPLYWKTIFGISADPSPEPHISPMQRTR